MLTKAIDAALPPRLGRGFRWLVASSWSTNLGDGLAISAGPLLIASQTDEPFVVALAAVAQQLPWVMFGLTAGVIADRHDRRRIMIIVNLARGFVLATLAAAIAFDHVNVPLVLVAMFLFGTTETFVDVTSGTMLPMTVAAEDLTIGNVRLTFGHTTLNRLVGPPLGAFLFAAGAAWPFVAQAILVVFGAMLIGRIALSIPSADHEDAHAGSIRSEIVEGLSWLWNDAPVRTLTVIILTFNVTFGATLAVFVLYVQRRLGLDEIGFGILEAVGAVGGMLGAVVYRRAELRFGMAHLMRIGLAFETVTHVIFGVTTLPAVAAATLFVFGIHEAVWGTTSTTIRQRSVPIELQGRIGAVYMLGVMGGLVVGAAIGGVLAQLWGITAPYWFAAIGDLAILVWIWSRIDAIASTRSVPTHREGTA